MPRRPPTPPLFPDFDPGRPAEGIDPSPPMADRQRVARYLQLCAHTGEDPRRLVVEVSNGRTSDPGELTAEECDRLASAWAREHPARVADAPEGVPHEHVPRDLAQERGRQSHGLAQERAPQSRALAQERAPKSRDRDRDTCAITPPGVVIGPHDLSAPGDVARSTQGRVPRAGATTSLGGAPGATDPASKLAWSTGARIISACPRRVGGNEPGAAVATGDVDWEAQARLPTACPAGSHNGARESSTQVDRTDDERYVVAIGRELHTALRVHAARHGVQMRTVTANAVDGLLELMMNGAPPPLPERWRVPAAERTRLAVRWPAGLAERLRSAVAHHGRPAHDLLAVALLPILGTDVSGTRR